MLYPFVPKTIRGAAFYFIASVLSVLAAKAEARCDAYEATGEALRLVGGKAK